MGKGKKALLAFVFLPLTNGMERQVQILSSFHLLPGLSNGISIGKSQAQKSDSIWAHFGRETRKLPLPFKA